MALVDSHRRLLDANGACVQLLGHRRSDVVGRPVAEFVVGGPQFSEAEWQAMMASGQFTGQAELVCANATRASVQWAGTTEVVTGRRQTLVVVLSTSRWGARFRRQATPSDPGALSAREREIVRFVALGHTGPEIADELRISHHTVRTHVSNAMTKLDARSRAHLVAKALGHDLVLD